MEKPESKFTLTELHMKHKSGISLPVLYVPASPTTRTIDEIEQDIKNLQDSGKYPIGEQQGLSQEETQNSLLLTREFNEAWVNKHSNPETVHSNGKISAKEYRIKGSRAIGGEYITGRKMLDSEVSADEIQYKGKIKSFFELGKIAEAGEIIQDRVYNKGEYIPAVAVRKTDKRPHNDEHPTNIQAISDAASRALITGTSIGIVVRPAVIETLKESHQAELNEANDSIATLLSRPTSVDIFSETPTDVEISNDIQTDIRSSKEYLQKLGPTNKLKNINSGEDASLHFGIIMNKLRTSYEGLPIAERDPSYRFIEAQYAEELALMWQIDDGTEMDDVNIAVPEHLLISENDSSDIVADKKRNQRLLAGIKLANEAAEIFESVISNDIKLDKDGNIEQLFDTNGNFTGRRASEDALYILKKMTGQDEFNQADYEEFVMDAFIRSKDMRIRALQMQLLRTDDKTSQELLSRADDMDEQTKKFLLKKELLPRIDHLDEVARQKEFDQIDDMDEEARTTEIKKLILAQSIGKTLITDQAKTAIVLQNTLAVRESLNYYKKFEIVSGMTSDEKKENAKRRGVALEYVVVDQERSIKINSKDFATFVRLSTVREDNIHRDIYTPKIGNIKIRLSTDVVMSDVNGDNSTRLQVKSKLKKNYNANANAIYPNQIMVHPDSDSAGNPYSLPP